MEERPTISQASPLERLVAKTTSLYSLPTVALEVLRLSANDQIDARALANCAERDPALTAKILRVVNSSVFGLSGQVSNLHQAVALLGARPLRMLVLGFSLPDKLIADLAGEQLRRYWTRNLTRAVAARELSEQLWRRAGDDAFIAALLREVGYLVLLRELGEPYAKFSQRVEEEERKLEQLERESLGFDHRELSAELLRRWRLPLRIVEAIRQPQRMLRLARLNPAEGELPQILYLADLVTLLVGDRRLSVLPDLLAAGEAFCRMSREQLSSIVAKLQPQVDELAGAMSVDLVEDRDYDRILIEAQARLSEVAEGAVAELALARDEQELCDALFVESRELGVAMRRFLRSQGRLNEPATSRPRPDAPHSSKRRHAQSAVLASPAVEQLLERLKKCAAACRVRRTEMSLLLFDAQIAGRSRNTIASEVASTLRTVFERVCEREGLTGHSVEPLRNALTAAVLPDCDRREAVAVAQRFIDACRRKEFQVLSALDRHLPTVHAGVASIAHIAKNFSVESLLTGAERCLAGAQSCSTHAVKSIEVF